MTVSPDAPKVIFTDDGWILSATEPPLTVEKLKEEVVDSHNWPGGALWWSIGDHEVYHYETEIGEIIGEAIEGLDEGTYSFVHSDTPGVIGKIAANVRALKDECGGPVTALSKLCREAGLQFFPRVRMSSHYEIDPRNPAYGRFRRDNPELLIGKPGEELAVGSLPWGQRTGLNYAFPEVREYMRRIIFETFERFDVDGVELDYMRHPGVFRSDEAYQNRYLMTDLIETVHKRLKEVGAERGRDLQLAVRVPPTLADSVRIGLDVERWIRDGLVDIVAVGGGFISFETPIREFVEAAEDSGCQIYGCIEATRHLDDDAVRALAARWLSHGATGIYLYNFYTIYPEWNKRIAEEVSDPVLLERVNKRYEMGQAGPLYPSRGHGGAFRYASPSTSLPVTLRPTFDGSGPEFSMEIVDDLDSAIADGALEACRLTLRFEDLSAQLEIEVTINGTTLPRRSGADAVDGWTRPGITPYFWMEYPAYPEEQTFEGKSLSFDLDSPPLRRGENCIAVSIVSPDGDERTTAKLDHVELEVAYKQ